MTLNEIRMRRVEYDAEEVGTVFAGQRQMLAELSKQLEFRTRCS